MVMTMVISNPELNFNLNQVCRHYLTGMLSKLTLDRNLLGPSGSSKSILGEKPPPSPMSQQSSTSSAAINSGYDPAEKAYSAPFADEGKENAGGSAGSAGPSGPTGGGTGIGLDNPFDEESAEGGPPPAVVVYMIDPFSLGVDNCDMLRLSSLGLLRCFNQILPHLTDLVRNNIYLQLVPLDAVFQLSQVRKNIGVQDQGIV